MQSYERVYALELDHHKFYVGTTLREMHVRYQEHLDRYGSRWTGRHRVRRCICWMRVPVGTSRKIENELTRYLMWTRGWTNVRGGDWVFLRCQSRNWLPREMRLLRATDVLPLHLRPMSHLRPETLRLIDALEMCCGLENADQLDADPFPEVTFSRLPNHLHHVDTAHPLPVALRA